MLNPDIWKDYFKPPFHNDKYATGTVWDAGGHCVLTSRVDFPDDADATMEVLVARLNGDLSAPRFEYAEYRGTDTDASIRFSFGGTDATLYVRGWGFLTGELGLDK